MHRAGSDTSRRGWAALAGLAVVLLTTTACEDPVSSGDGASDLQPDGGLAPLDGGAQEPGGATFDGGAIAADAGLDARDAGAHPDAGRNAADAGGNLDAGSHAVDGGAHVDAGAPPNDTPDAGNGGTDGVRTCDQLPVVSDFGARGPFEVEVVAATGPNHNYTLFRPRPSPDGRRDRHPIGTWGNGIMTTPDEYTTLLTLIASHGFVIIACNDTQAERACLEAGLDWLVAQDQSGPMAGTLDVEREVTIGYSWGGGAAIDTASRPHVKATVSLHGMPPRQTNAFTDMHDPLLLFTSTGDSFVTADGYVTPNFQNSKVQTFYATLEDSSVGHLYPVDIGSFGCLASPFLGSCGSAQLERAPTVAWLRMLACGDRSARSLFYGPDCTMCRAPWSAQKKGWPQPDSPW